MDIKNIDGRSRYINNYVSPLGELTMASDGSYITGLWFAGQKYFGAGLEQSCVKRALPVFDETKKWLDIYFSGVNPSFFPALRPMGTPFRMAVWKVLTDVPYGGTVSYRDVASKLEKEYHLGGGSARAAGGAIGHNPISILIPCHRVVGADGRITGYAGGIKRKIKLLELERGAGIF